MMLILLAVLGITPLLSAGPVSGTPRTLPQVSHPLVFRPASLSTPGSPPYVPADIRKAYDFTPLMSKGILGNGTRIAIVDAYGSTSLLTDVAKFDSLTGLPSASIRFAYPDGVPAFQDSGWALETSLDVEWAHAIAPNAGIDLVVAFDSGIDHVYDGIAYVANSLPNENVLSMSFGQSESAYPTTGTFSISSFHQLFVTMTSHGTTPFASSGDSGSAGCCDVSYPASDPTVVAVGGTSLNLNSNSSYVSETTWSGSSAGSSVAFSSPSWQQFTGDTGRDIVDVSYDADPATGFMVIRGGAVNQVGGTSAGAPQWAALVALANQANHITYGAMNARLYREAAYHDVTAGDNGFFTARPGWDFPTGLGSPDANALVKATPGITLTVTNSRIFQGFNVTTKGQVLANLSNSTTVGTVTVTATNAMTGLLAFTKTFTLSGVRIQNMTTSLRSLFTFDIPLSPYPLSSDVTITISNATAASFVQVTRQVNIAGAGFVSITDVTIVNSHYGASMGMPNYDPLADLGAIGQISISDATIVNIYYNAPSFE